MIFNTQMITNEEILFLVSTFSTIERSINNNTNTNGLHLERESVYRMVDWHMIHKNEHATSGRWCFFILWCCFFYIQSVWYSTVYVKAQYVHSTGFLLPYNLFYTYSTYCTRLAILLVVLPLLQAQVKLDTLCYTSVKETPTHQSIPTLYCSNETILQ